MSVSRGSVGIPWGMGGPYKGLQRKQEGMGFLRLQACCSGNSRGNVGADVDETLLGQRLSRSSEP